MPPKTAALLLALAMGSTASAGEARKFGTPLQGMKATRLHDVLAKPEDGRVVRLEGKVQAVCRNKGCWLELAQGGSSIHVTFEGYSFFLPKDAAGKHAVLEGKVVVKQPAPPALKLQVGLVAKGLRMNRA